MNLDRDKIALECHASLSAAFNLIRQRVFFKRRQGEEKSIRHEIGGEKQAQHFAKGRMVETRCFCSAWGTEQNTFQLAVSSWGTVAGMKRSKVSLRERSFFITKTNEWNP